MPYSETDDEAGRRAVRFKSLDPYPAVPCSTLSSEHIADYICATGLIFPFNPERIKTASYEIRAGGSFFYWINEKGDSNSKNKSRKKYSYDVSKFQYIEIPANSISFVGIDCKLRLPNYIAMRFNLHIKHVHRGLLLGTGPIVDPGFEGHLLIPLHNLTNSPYRIQVGDGLIWTEFTKTTFTALHTVDRPSITFLSPPRVGRFVPFPLSKINLSDDDYINKSTNGEGAENSIPSIVLAVQSDIRSINKQVTRSLRAGWIAIGLTVFVALLGIFPTLFMLYQITQSYLVANNDILNRITAVEASMKEISALRSAVNQSQSDMSKELSRQGGQIIVVQDKLLTIQDTASRLDAAYDRTTKELDELKANVSHFSAASATHDGAFKGK